jgi:DNA replication protein DnaC
MLSKILQPGTDISFDPAEYEQKRADGINGQVGELKGYDCQECKNRGYIAVVVNGSLSMRECRCMATRRSQRHIERSGLKSQLEDCTFAKYQTPEQWQAEAKLKAQNYLTDNCGKWFLACGSVGSGKTHLCTAICGEFLNMGKEVRYMLWRDEAVQLKAAVNDSEYARLINPLKTTEVLYIDDFFKTEKDKKPTTGDIHLAFELLNYRYNDKKLLTIISTEKHMKELLDIDEAVGSRIYQRAKESIIPIQAIKIGD